MVRIAALFLFGFFTAAALFVGKFVSFGNLRFSEGKFYLERLVIKLPSLEVGVYGITLMGRNLKVSSLTFDVKTASEKKGKSEIRPVWIRNGFDIFGKILKKFPLKVKFDTVFAKSGTVSVNIYGLKVQKEKFFLKFLSILQNSREIFNLSAKIHSNKALKGVFLYVSPNILAGKTEFLYSKGRLMFDSTDTIFSKTILLGGNFTLSKKLIGGRTAFRLSPFSGKSLLTFDGRFLRFSGNLIAPNLRVNFNGSVQTDGNYGIQYGGTYRFCGKKVYFSGTFENGNFYLSSGIVNTPFYGGISLKTYNGRIDGFLSAGKGWISIGGKLNKLHISFHNAEIGPLCGVKVSNLNGVLRLTERFLKGVLNWDSLSYTDFLRIKNQKLAFGYAVDRKKGFINLDGSIGGKFFVESNELFAKKLWGNITIYGRGLRFSLRDFSASLSNNPTAEVRVTSLSYGDFEIGRTKLVFSKRGKNLSFKFGGDLSGFLNLKLLSKLPYSITLNGKIYKGKKAYIFALKGKGNLAKGYFGVSSSGLNLNVGYTRREKMLKTSFFGSYKNEASLRGYLDLKKKHLSGNFSFAYRKKLWSFFEKFSLKGNLSRKFFLLTGEPSELLYGNYTIFRTNGFKAFLTTDEWGFSVYPCRKVPVTVELNISGRGKNVKLLNGYLLLKTEVLNLFLSNFYTFVPKNYPVRLNFYYRGNIGKLVKGLKVYGYSGFPLYSAFFYNPLHVSLSALNLNGTYSLVVTLSGNGGENYGGLSARYDGENFSVWWNIYDLPLKPFYSDLFFAYLKLSGVGSAEFSNGLSVKADLSLGGYAKILKYELPKMKQSQSTTTSNVDYSVSLHSYEPLFVESPNGYAVITYRGYINNRSRNFVVHINYGKLNIFGKEFYINGGKVLLKEGEIFVDLPMTLYTPDRTVYIRIFGKLPWQNLRLEINSVPPASEEELLLYIVSGGGSASQVAENLPIAGVFLRALSSGVVGLINGVTSALVKGLEINFVPSFDPLKGPVMGVEVKKYFGDYAKAGYRKVFSRDPKESYWWASLKFLYGSYLRFSRYEDDTYSLSLRFLTEWGSPY